MRKTLRKLLIAVVVLACVALLVFALIRASDYNAPQGAGVTRQTIAEKLYQPPKTPKQDDAPATPGPGASTDKPAAKRPATEPLSTTGPENTIVVFVVSSVAGAMVAYAVQLRKMYSF